MGWDRIPARKTDVDGLCAAIPWLTLHRGELRRWTLHSIPCTPAPGAAQADDSEAQDFAAAEYDPDAGTDWLWPTLEEAEGE
jgi:hypothetical protein